MAGTVTHELWLDLKKETQLVPDAIEVRVGEGGTQTFRVHLELDGAPYRVEEGWSATLRLLTGANVPKTQEAEVGGDGRDELTVTLADEMLTDEGTCKLAYFALTGPSSQTLTTEGFKLRILGSTIKEAAGQSWDSRMERLIGEFEAEVAHIKAKEAERVANEEVREAAESARAEAETGRVEAESARAQAETLRESAEDGREGSEALRDSAESARAQAEDGRETAESGRMAAETERAEAETARKSAESGRETAESGRVAAEAGRVEAESGRETAESERAGAETRRAAAEDLRVESENAREEAEDARERAEEARESDETARRAAEQGRESAETLREDAETARSEAESARSEAEAARDEAETARADAERQREEYATQLRADVDAGVYDGATFTPTVSPEGVISWTNDKERPNPEAVDIKGPRGDVGEGLEILGVYDSIDAIREAHPKGDRQGDGYMGGTHYYVWDGSDWADCGELKGAKGDTGEQGPPGENATTTELASVDAPGLLRQLSGSEDEVLLGNGEWGEYRGGGSAGPLWLEVDEAGDLYAYYDDNYGEPNLKYEEGTGNLYAIFETEV